MSRPSPEELRPILQFLRELARRSVVRVTVAYLVGAWVLTQVASVLLPVIGFGADSLRVVLVLLAIGLPVAIGLAWYFDLTPEGLRLANPAASGSTGDVPNHGFAGPPADDASLAVMAFADRSEAQDQDFLAHGLSEELTNILGRVGGLKIAPRTSAFAFKGRSMDVREIGQRLNVAAVLDGSVRRSGDRLRIAVELIDVASGYCRWMNVYDRPSSDVFDLQEDIARSIVGELKSNLLGAAAPEVHVDPGTDDADAYDSYLKGRHYWNSRYAVGLERSIECFGRAAEIDPGYALPLSGLADAYSLLAFYNFLPPRDGFAKAAQFARRAHELAPGLAETNASVAFVQHFFDWDFPAAEASYRRALECDPGYGPARFWYAFLLVALGRPDEALAEIDAARAAEPFSAIINGGASYLDYFLGRNAAGIQAATEVLRADPNFGPAYMFLGFHELAAGHPDEAVPYWRKAVEREERLVLARLMLACALARSGADGEAAEVLQYVDNGATGYVSSYFRAATLLALGRKDGALESLERSLTERNCFLVLAAVDPLFEDLRDEPRFRRVIASVGVARAGTARLRPSVDLASDDVQRMLR